MKEKFNKITDKTQVWLKQIGVYVAFMCSLPLASTEFIDYSPENRYLCIQIGGILAYIALSAFALRAIFGAIRYFTIEKDYEWRRDDL